MAKQHGLTEKERAAIKARIERWVAESPKLSWRERANVVRDRIKEGISNQALTNASNAIAGPDVASKLERFFGERLQDWVRDLDAPRPAPTERVVVPVERYDTVAVAFERARSAGVNEHTLNVVRMKIGVAKSDKPPTLEEVEQAIRDEQTERRRVMRMYTDDIDAGILRAAETVATKPKGRTR